MGCIFHDEARKKNGNSFRQTGSCPFRYPRPAVSGGAAHGSEGINVLKLNTGNPGRFGFKLPNSVRQALALHIDEAVPYCDVRGMAAARNVICTYHIGRGLQGIMPNDVFICNGVSEAASMLLNALIGTGDEILLPSPCYSLWSNNAYLCGGKPVFYRCDPANEWNPDIEDIESKITDRTKAILVINPNNRPARFTARRCCWRLRKSRVSIIW